MKYHDYGGLQHVGTTAFGEGSDSRRTTRWVSSACCLAIIFLCWAGSAIAQSTPVRTDSIPDAVFGEIPDSLLTMSAYGPDPSAPYFYAFKEVYISFEEEQNSITANLDYHVRIKVFDADARQASTVAIPYYFQNDIERIERIRGYTHHPGGDKVPLQVDQVRQINLNARYNVREFTMPEVTDGSVIEYTYRKKRQFIEELPDFYLSHQAPTAIAKATIRYPRYLRYDVVPVDFSGEVEHIEQRIDTSSVPKVFSLPRPEPLVLDHWLVREVPAVEQEAFISSINDYRGKLKFQLREFGIPRQRLENSWELVVAQLRRNQNPWSEIEQNSRAARLGRMISQSLSSPVQVQDSIFRYLNDRVRFSDQRTVFSDVQDDSVLEGSIVDQAAINQTLTAMLRGGGIDAWPMLISTRPYGRINRSFPSFYQFNGQITYSEIDGDGYFMDASFPHSYPDLLPVETFNEHGLVLRENSYEWLELKPENSRFSITVDMNASLDRQGTLTGSIQTKQFGYPARLIREKAAEGTTDEQILRNTMFDRYTDVTLENVQVENLRQFGDSVVISSAFTIRNYATSFTDGLDYQPLVVGSLMSNPFEQDRRDLPVTLDAPEELDLSFQLDLPEGLTLGSGTENRAIQLPGAELEEYYSSADRVVTYRYNIDISRKQFEPELYPRLLDLYERWVELSNMSWRIKRQ
ncbi:MAG: DUF3857 domain-containing protein [Balneolaceae bacterium]|nr:DUF3857 domain-containing protein [Balneolaceae bacterium]